MPNTPRFQPTRLVELLAFEEVQLLDVTGPLQVFATANDLAPHGTALYALRVVSAHGGPVAASAGLRLETEPLGDEDAPIDTLIIPGGRGTRAAMDDAPLRRWTLARAAKARRTASVCTGAFLLAATGLLEGRRAVTHWAYCDELAARFPKVRVEADPIFLNDGPVWTSAGVTAGIDLALAFVEQDCGRDHALAVARHLVVFLRRPGGQSQFSAALGLQQGGDGFDALHGWMAENLAKPLGVACLAQQAGMSERSFARHYRDKVGTTPAAALERLRVEAGRRLLADGPMPIKRIARHCDFGSEETMRRAFLRRLATSPNDYRSRFQAADTVRGSRIVRPQTSP